MSEETQIKSQRERRPAQRVVCCTPIDVGIDPAEVAGRAKLLAALSDPTRLQIVEMLDRLDEPICVCDVQSQFDLGQPTISHHLKVLREARLVNWEKRGLWVYYSLNRQTVGDLADYLAGLAAAFQGGASRRSA